MYKVLEWRLFRYPQSHLTVAIILSLSVSLLVWGVSGGSFLQAATALPGIFFYAGREVRDFQKNVRPGSADRTFQDFLKRPDQFDWPGFLWPVVPLVVAELVLEFPA
ncbi:hypothetical protein NBRC116590_02580 [Pelagimonas sp. KU-00592-HH]|uniref:hypothetical protein n=1 Tax=Pelagimonas sp. KU-00592-HH TaxID=3127651 RepID=UPI00310B76BC